MVPTLQPREPNHSFNQLAHAFVGGSTALLLRTIEGVISSHADLASIIDIIEPGSSYLHQLRALPGCDTANFGSFLLRFLQNTGWPTVEMADGLQNLTNVTDEEIQSPAFCSQMFHLAAFNRDLILDGTRIRVSFVGSNVSDTSSLPFSTRNAMANGSTFFGEHASALYTFR
ncbi:hypothetical protein M407DRAFT_242302 [Tulasnella calospora MUT 4182]|uniref:Uncharacterized protein n=1 Tax=Tulasnella calospora MUT 4182 TaxID=1051891 RepID=A0A0C3QPA9_9AGAM|nr:hypothetical protein M407DRAFT_242302 [Tulasnella calospora MUT 4182]